MPIKEERKLFWGYISSNTVTITTHSKLLIYIKAKELFIWFDYLPVTSPPQTSKLKSQKPTSNHLAFITRKEKREWEQLNLKAVDLLSAKNHAKHIIDVYAFASSKPKPKPNENYHSNRVKGQRNRFSILLSMLDCWVYINETHTIIMAVDWLNE